MHVVTTVLHTDKDKATSALLIFQSCNVTCSIQFRRELAAMHYVTLLGTAGEMRSNGYLIAVHSFRRPTLYYDWRKTLDDVTNCNFQHSDMWGRISLLIGWLEKESVVKIYIYHGTSRGHGHSETSDHMATQGSGLPQAIHDMLQIRAQRNVQRALYNFPMKWKFGSVKLFGNDTHITKLLSRRR